MTLIRVLVTLLGLVSVSSPLAALEVSGKLAVETTLFTEAPRFPQQQRQSVSLSLEPEFFQQWDGGNQGVLFHPFIRLDGDRQRAHQDIRELLYFYYGEQFELRAGIGKVFWGVTETLHLVDIINQTDLVEDQRGEEKLGQPMVNLTLLQEAGSLDLFWLPRFRERTYPGEEGRLRTAWVVSDSALYQSDRGRSHQDWALRWSASLGSVDYAVSHFSGTQRSPTFTQTAPQPFYPQLQQTGLELQLVDGDTLWKMEAVRRKSQGVRDHAWVGGLEHTLVGIAESSFDLGLIAEYQWDERGYSSSLQANDLVLGGRLLWNDAEDTRLLIALSSDLDQNEQLLSVEGSSRMGEGVRLGLYGSQLIGVEQSHPLLGSLVDDHYIKLTLSYFF